ARSRPVVVAMFVAFATVSATSLNPPPITAASPKLATAKPAQRTRPAKDAKPRPKAAGTAPSVLSFTPSATTVTTGSLTYALVFSELVTGLATTDFTLSGTSPGWAVAS